MHRSSAFPRFVKWGIISTMLALPWVCSYCVSHVTLLPLEQTDMYWWQFLDLLGEGPSLYSFLTWQCQVRFLWLLVYVRYVIEKGLWRTMYWPAVEWFHTVSPWCLSPTKQKDECKGKKGGKGGSNSNVVGCPGWTEPNWEQRDKDG